MVTTKTADLLSNMSLRLSAIADAVHPTDKDIAAEIAAAAAKLANCSAALEQRLGSYAKTALNDEQG